MNVAAKSAALGVAGLSTGAAAALTLRRLRRPKPVRATITLTLAPGERGMEVHLESYQLSKERLKALLRDIKADIEAGEIPTGERST